jgi:hypothetical protein
VKEETNETKRAIAKKHEKEILPITKNKACNINKNKEKLTDRRLTMSMESVLSASLHE